MAAGKRAIPAEVAKIEFIPSFHNKMLTPDMIKAHPNNFATLIQRI
jgi:hypothetical protein